MSSRTVIPTTLVATLGSEPQVVTAALDLLLADGAAIDQVYVIHTAADREPIRSALWALTECFTDQFYQPPISLHSRPICDGGLAVADVETHRASAAAFQTLYGVIHQLKQENRQVHLCIAGGRKNMAIYGMVVAQILFDGQDHLWHLFSGGDFLASKRLHPQSGDDARLVEIPVLLRSVVSPVFAGLRDITDAEVALQRAQALALEERMADLRTFLFGALTPAERRVVELLVREGLSDQEIAVRLCLSSRTVEAHLRSAYAKAANHWELAAVTRAYLAALLSPYYTFTPRPR